MLFQSRLMKKIALLLLTGLLCTTGVLDAGLFRKKKYANPINKDTLQPDKVLFDRAINDIEHGRYEVARLTLNTLINTYDSSEFLAKAKLAIADSWFREGGAHALAQAEAEYKDFILFYPQMEEAAESQWKICDIHYKQMEKVDRDSAQAQRTEDECRTLVTQFPNSKYIPTAQQMLRNVQEVLGEKEFRTGSFYHMKGSYPAAANRLTFVADQYPLYSGTDEALWQAADSFNRMGDRFESQAAEDYTRIVKDYPLSRHAKEATAKLEDMKRPVPKADPAALARMQYEMEHRTKVSMMRKSLGLLQRGPDTSMAAKQGSPTMTAMRPPTPVSVPSVAAINAAAGAAEGGGVSDVGANIVNNPSEVDTKPEARQTAPAAGGAAAAGGAETPAGTPGAAPSATVTAGAPGAAAATPAKEAAPQAPLPTNHQQPQIKKSKKQLKKEEELRKKQEAAAQQAAPKPTTDQKPPQ
jgi:outer membrane protein assembly factor BamD